MRGFHSTNRAAAILSAILLIATMLFTASCAEKKYGGKTFQRGTHPRKDVIRPAEQRPAEEVASPQRVASNQLVDKGLNHLDAKEYELAAVRFQDAINIDPRNGIAYYYLAMTDYYTGQSDVALGLLDKAQSLIGHDAKWNERIENLRASILTEEATATQPAEPI